MEDVLEVYERPLSAEEPGLNQAELEIGPFSKQCLGKRRLGKIRILRAEARAWNRRTNRNRITINWTFDRKKARTKFNYKYKTKRS
jgi:hypothetical protein